MKHIIGVAALAVGSIVMGDTQREALIAISPFLQADEKAKLEQAVLEFALIEAKPGTGISFVDGWSCNTIAEIVVPELARDTPRARQRLMASGVGALIKWFRSEQPPVEMLKGRGSLDTPRLWTAIERKKPDTVLLAGSPVYMDPDAPEHSWLQLDGENQGLWYPVDAAFFTVGGLSPWGVDTNRKRLQGASVHWLLRGDSEFADGRYFDRVRRFYSIYCELEGGDLLSFSGDASDAFGSLFRTDLVPYRSEVDLTHTKLVMKQPGSVVEFSKESDIKDVVSVPLGMRAKPVRRVLVVDITKSMEKLYGKVAREIAQLPDGENTLLVTYSDHFDPRVVTIFEESDNASELARTLRSIELTNGEDEPEALGDALLAVRKEIEARGIAGSVEITVWTDAPPKAASDVPTGVDCIEQMNALMHAGHSIVLVKCHGSQSFDWAPSGIQVRKLGR